MIRCGDIEIRLAGADALVEYSRRSAIGGQNNRSILRHNANQINGQDIQDIIDIAHVTVARQLGIVAV